MRLNNLEKQAHSEALQLNTVLATSNAGERFTPSVQLLYDGEKHFSLRADATQVLKLLLKKAMEAIRSWRTSYIDGEEPIERKKGRKVIGQIIRLSHPSRPIRYVTARH